MQNKTEHANDTVGELRGFASPSKSKLFASILALSATLAVGGCEKTYRLPDGTEVVQAPADTLGFVSDREAFVSRLRKAENVVIEKPSFVVNIPDGERLMFFVDDHDDGVAVLGEIHSSSTRGSALDHPDLQDATPAMIYHAVTKDDSEIPEALVQHHDFAAREFDLAQLEVMLEGRDRGWFLTAEPNPQSSSPCLNATFTTNICANPAYDEAYCKKNTSGSWLWNVPGAYRYKAGFCLQQGQAHSWLTYTHGNWDPNFNGGACVVWNDLHVAWGQDSLLFDQKWAATTYLNYVWWTGSEVRNYSHFGGYGTGDLFDWGQRYSWKYCSEFD